MHRLLASLALLVSLPAGAVTMDWVYIGNPGNAADRTEYCFGPNCGSVSYGYYISKYEVTNSQYTEFLNAKAAADPFTFYYELMGSDAEYGGITPQRRVWQLHVRGEARLREQAGGLRLLLRRAALRELAEQRAFRPHGVRFRPCDVPKSTLYSELDE